MKSTVNTILLLLFICFEIIVAPSLISGQATKNKNDQAQQSQKLPTNFIYFFPDTGFAMSVAEVLDKNINDKVTEQELSNIKGYFEVGPGFTSNLKGLRYLTGIDTFECYKNEVTEIPEEIGNLLNLTYLDLCKAFEIVKIPPQIGQLKKLKRIRIALTEIKTIPKEIGELTELESLDICCNQLTEIPKELGNLKKLVELDIHSNELKTIPDKICNLTSLKTLDISHCGLEKLPENIGNLKNLRSFNLFNNKLKRLPTSIKYLSNLTYLNLYNNYSLSGSYKKNLPVSLKKRTK